MRLTFLSCALTLLVGCGPSPVLGGVDAGEADAPLTRSIRFVPSAPLRLEPGSRAPLAVQVRDDRGLLMDEEVRFALLGETADGSLTATRARTGNTGADLGIARSTLLAPTTGGSAFRVRATVAGAPSVFLEVGVSAQGFGALAVSSVYSGVRMPSVLSVGLYPGATCSGIDALEPLRQVQVPVSGARVTFGELVVGGSFAVSGRALGASGDVVARACLDGLTVQRDRELSSVLRFADEPLRPSGSYEIEMELDLLPVATEAQRQWQEALRSAAPQGDADLLLQAIGEALEMRSGLAVRREYERSLTAGYRALVLADLGRRGASPLLALQRLAEDTATVARGATVHVGVTSQGTSMGEVFVVRGVQATLDPLTPDVARDDTTWSPMPAGTATFSLRPGDRVRVELRAFPLAFAALARRSMDALLGRLGISSASEWAQVTTRCRELAPVLTPITPGCDAVCVANACDAALTALAGRLDTAVENQSRSLQTASLSFEGVAHSLGGTLRVDTTDRSSLMGAYEGETSIGFSGVAFVRTP